jgi:hypothetical protein
MGNNTGTFGYNGSSYRSRQIICPSGLMLFVGRRLPANDKIYISVLSVSLW